MTVPIARPGKIVCVGLNYKDHAEEQGAELPAAPLLFAKFTTSLIGPGDPIVIPPIVTKCDYEAELGVVIGTTVRGVSKENAFEAVAGYVVANDVSARDLQFSDGQWTRGKSPDAFCPVGPLVPVAEVSDPHALGIRAILNGDTVQDSTTANLIFGIDEVIAYVVADVDARGGRPHPHRDPGRRGRLSRPAAAPRARRRDHDRDRRDRLDHEPGHGGVAQVRAVDAALTHDR